MNENGDLTDLERKVWEYIVAWDAKALRPSGNVLAALCSTSRRTVQRAVNRLRRKGYPVGSSSGRHFGYFVARTPEQIAATHVHLVNRVREAEMILHTFDRITKPALLEALGQERMVQDA